MKNQANPVSLMMPYIKAGPGGRTLSLSHTLLLQRLCSSLPDDPSAIGQLDPDTALSRGTWRAALAGVGSCCHAIDSIMAGKVLPFLSSLLDWSSKLCLDLKG